MSPTHRLGRPSEGCCHVASSDEVLGDVLHGDGAATDVFRRAPEPPDFGDLVQVSMTPRNGPTCTAITTVTPGLPCAGAVITTAGRRSAGWMCTPISSLASRAAASASVSPASTRPPGRKYASTWWGRTTSSLPPSMCPRCDDDLGLCDGVDGVEYLLIVHLDIVASS